MKTNTEMTELTTGSPMSHYGIPVLRVTISGKSVDLGPADLLPDEINSTGTATAAHLVVSKAIMGIFDRAAAELFCSQWPEGPQVPTPTIPPSESETLKHLFGG